MTKFYKAVDADGNPISLVVATNKRTITLDAIVNKNGGPDGETQVQIREYPTFEEAKERIGVKLHEIEPGDHDDILFDEWAFDGSEKYGSDELDKADEKEKVENPGEDPEGPGKPSSDNPGDDAGANRNPPQVDNDHVEDGAQEFTDAEIEANKAEQDGKLTGIQEGSEPEFNDRTQNGVDVSSTPPSDAPVVETGGPVLDDNSVAK